MSVLDFALIAFFVSFAAGVLGSLVGLGGGIVIVPVLTLAFHVDIRLAIGASLVAVIATSSGAAVAYVREHLTNLRVAMFLEVSTTSGAMTGALVAGFVGAGPLFVLFGLTLTASAIAMLRRESKRTSHRLPESRMADVLRLDGAYFDPSLSRLVDYRVRRPLAGFGLMFLAGIMSGLLGIGSGSLKVPAMDLVMRLPIKVSTATSNFMIGVTAAGGAMVYLARGLIEPLIAGPVAGGVLIGAFAGSRILPRLRNRSVRLLFVGVLLLVAVQMIRRGLT